LETRSETVRVPVTKQEYVPQKQVQQVPVTNTRLAEETHIHRVAVGTVSDGSGTLTANRADGAGGTKLDNDPPRNGATQWHGESSRP
jgi:hypothetical protein